MFGRYNMVRVFRNMRVMVVWLLGKVYDLGKLEISGGWG